MRGRVGLDSGEYDDWLAKCRKTKELRERHEARRNANKGIEGWHFGLGDRPVRIRNKEEFKRELDSRGLMLKDDVRKDLK